MPEEELALKTRSDFESRKMTLRMLVGTLGLVRAAAGTKFTLASGAKSDFYIDFDRVMMTPAGSKAVIECLFYAVANIDCNAIGGPSSGIDPIIGGLLPHLYDKQILHVRGFKVRKEPKGRGPGAGEMIEGYLKAGDKAIVIEDVTTSGGSVLKAIAEVEKVGAMVVKVITLLDRQAGASEKLAGYDFEPLLKLDELAI